MISLSEVLLNFKVKVNCERNDVSATGRLANFRSIRLLESDLRTELQTGMDVTTSFSAFERFSNTINIFLASPEFSGKRIKLNQMHINITDTLSA